MRLPLFLLIATTAFAAWGLMPSSAVAQAPTAPNPPRSPNTADSSAGVSVATVEAAPLIAVDSIEVRWQFSGTIQARRRSDLSFERVGRIDAIHVDRGDLVQQGQVLAELNTDQLKAQLQKLEADRLSAAAVLAELKAGARKESLAAARATIDEQQVQLDNAKQNFLRRERLYKERLVSTEELEQAATAVKRWQASTEAAIQRWQELAEGTREEKIQSQEATVAAIAAGMEALRVEIKHSSLTSPYAGTVVDRTLDEGSVVAPGRPVLTILENPHLEAHIGVPAETARLLSVAESLEIEVRETKLPGRIRSILQEVADSSRTQKVILSLAEDASLTVVPGEVARLTLSRKQPASGYWLPSAALLKGPRGLWECFVLTNVDATGVGVLERRSVEIVHTDGERVLIRGSVRPNELAVVSATHRVSEGQQARAGRSGSNP